MTLLDPQDADNSLEDCSRQLHQFVSNANNFHVKSGDKYTRSVECVVFIITNGRFPAIHGTRLNMAIQNAIGFALSRLLDGEDVTAINLKKVFSTC
jgi:hypothetical protein